MNVIFVIVILWTNVVVVTAAKSRAAIAVGTGPASQISCVVLNNGLGIKCFGGNSNGQLGQLSTTNEGDFGIYEMGDCLRISALGDNANPIQVVMGSTFTCALLQSGSARCFGSCSTGVCGNGQTSGNLGDSQSANPANQPLITFSSSIVQLTAGEGHVCALLEDRTARCWGTGSDGQLGTGSIISILATPPSAPINFGLGRKVREISAGYTHTCAVLDSATYPNETDLVCFGSCLFGKCGSGDSLSIVQTGDSLGSISLGFDAQKRRRWATHVSAGAAHTCVVLNTGEAACFGLGILLGTGSTNNVGDNPFEMDSLQTVSLGGRQIVSISAGQQHTCTVVQVPSGRKFIQKVVCWGQGASGVLGYDSQDNVLVPGSLTVKLPEALNVTQVSAYSSHTCAVGALPKGQVFCWGNKSFGRLGLLSLGASTAPCVGCSRGQMKSIKSVNLGCSSLTSNKSCPYFIGSNPKCQVCRGSWPKSLCRTYSFRCVWLFSAKKCATKSRL